MTEYRVRVVIQTTTEFDVVATDRGDAESAALKLADTQHGAHAARAAKALYRRPVQTAVDGWEIIT